MQLSVLSLAGAAGATGDPLAVQPLSADPWLGPIGPTALYAADEPIGGRRGLWLGVSAGVSRPAGERQRVHALLELGIGIEAVLSPDGSTALAPSREDATGDAEADAERVLADPSRSDRRLEPQRSLATEADPRPPDPRPGLPRRTAPAPFDPAPFDPAPFDPAPFDPAPFDPAPFDPAPFDPAPFDPAPRGAAPRVDGRGCGLSRSCDPAAVAALARAVVAEALRVQGGGLELRRLDGMAARSRAAAALPELRLGAGTSRDESLRLSPTLADPARFTRDGGRDLWLEARLTWRLDGALFARDEIAIMRLRAQQRDEAARLTRGVLDALVALERARLLLASETAPVEEREAAIIRQFGAVAELDVLTGGWFSRQLARARARVPGADGAPAAGP